MSWKNNWKKTTWMESPFSVPHRKRQAVKKLIAGMQLWTIHAQMIHTINQQRAVTTRTAEQRSAKVLAISKTQVDHIRLIKETLEWADT